MTTVLVVIVALFMAKYAKGRSEWVCTKTCATTYRRKWLTAISTKTGEAKN